MGKFLKKLKQVSIKDIKHIFLFAIALVPARRLKRKRPELWLVCEYAKEARDNGYWFYRHVREKHPKQDIVYAIELDSRDAKRVAELGEVIPYGSFKHWIYYLAAKINISSHKGGKPNAAVCYLLEVYGIWKNTRVFLQHGVTKDLIEIFFYKNTKIRLFICGAEPEYRYVKQHYGYPEGYVTYTGLARFDNLLSDHEVKKQILVAPTWRSWLYDITSDPYINGNQQAAESVYVKRYKELLTDKKITELLQKYGYELVFFPHRNMTSLFEGEGKVGANIRVETWKNVDLQKLLMESACMITDYSSTAMDFAYMGKPLLYYQFDQERFWKDHFKEGYFSYEEDGFGPVVISKEELYRELEMILKNNGVTSELYRARMDKFFPLRDSNNCERIYQAIKAIN